MNNNVTPPINITFISMNQHLTWWRVLGKQALGCEALPMGSGQVQPNGNMGLSSSGPTTQGRTQRDPVLCGSGSSQRLGSNPQLLKLV